MANRLKGITLEIGGDTTNLSKSLSGINSDIKNTQTQLKDVQKLLKLDPTNVELLRQKHQLLEKSVDQTKKKLEALKQAQQVMDANGVDRNSDQYMNLRREIIEAENSLKSFEESAKKANATLEQIGATAGKIATGAEKVAKATKAMSAAAAGGLASIAGMAYGSVTMADDLNTLAKQTGFTTGELQKMKYAADLIDTSMEDITASAVKLKKNMASGSDSVVSAFKALGVNTKYANGELRNSTDVYWEVVEALSRVQNETTRDVLAMTLLGKSADSLAGIVDDGGQALRSYGDDAERLGYILNQETLDGLNAVNDKIDTVKASAKSTLAVAGAKAVYALIPIIEQIVQLLAAALTWIGSLDSSQIKMLVTILAIVAAISPIAGIIAGIANAVSALIPLILSMNAAFAANPYILVAVAIAAAIAFITYEYITHIDAIKAAFSAMLEYIRSGFQSFCDFLEAVDVALGQGLLWVIDGVIGAIKAILNSGIQLAEDFCNTVLGILNAVISAINAVGGAIASVVGGSFGGFSKFSSVRLPKLANGGEVLTGTALVGEAGPELLTVKNGRTVVTPLAASDSSANTGAAAVGSQNIVTDVRVHFTGSLSQLAHVLQPAIVAETTRRGNSFIK